MHSGSGVDCWRRWGRQQASAFGRSAPTMLRPSVSCSSEPSPTCPPIFRPTPPKRRYSNRALEMVQLGLDADVPIPLRGRSIADQDVGRAEPLNPMDGEHVLAHSPRGPVWTVSTAGSVLRTRGAVAPDELAPDERLCDRLVAGRFASLLPLLEFLRSITTTTAFVPAPVRAAFVIDDPNLHASSYGFLRYEALATLGRRHGFHVALATVPLDSWLARRGPARHFRGAEPPLSLLVHGNDHVRQELAREGTERQVIARMAQAQRRIERLEQRADVTVSRVMAPPHGACSQLTMAALPRVGFEALCISRPYPWLDEPPADQPRAGWHAADMVEGLTVLPRSHLRSSRENLPFTAYLGRPIILYGHHGDAADGLDVFVEAAEDVNRLGTVSWLPLHAIARTSFETRRQGSELGMRLWTRLASLTVPAGVETVVVEQPPVAGSLEIDGAAGRVCGQGHIRGRGGRNADAPRLPRRACGHPVGRRAKGRGLADRTTDPRRGTRPRAADDPTNPAVRAAELTSCDREPSSDKPEQGTYRSGSGQRDSPAPARSTCAIR